MNKKIRIMHIASGIDQGGVAELLLITAKFNERHKYDLAFTAWGAQKGTISREIEKLGYPVYEMDISSRIYDLRAIPRLIRIFHLYNPDIVHFYTKIGFTGRIVAKIARIPIIICNEVDLFTKDAGFKLKLLTILKRKTDFLADRLIACSAAVQQHWGSKNSNKYKLMYLPIDTEKISAYRDQYYSEGSNDSLVAPTLNESTNIRDSQKKSSSETGLPRTPDKYQLFKNDSGPIIGIVSRIHPGKGHEYLIKAMPSILNSYPTAKLRIVGTGSLINEMKCLAHSLNIADSIEFAGFAEDLYSELYRMDIFVLPSITEGFPLCLMEAMAIGLPVAATSVGGIPELIREGESGVFFDIRNPDSLAETVIKLLNNFDKTILMGLRGQKKVFKQFTPQVYMNNLEHLYQELIKEKGIE